jgi:glycosyltransferase involved in cell wall biosynthesis
MALRVLSAILFSPRGGSAHVARALARGLREGGHEVTLVSGSRNAGGPEGDARAFYGDVRAVDFSPALATDAPLQFEGPSGTAPMHPSFEDRKEAPDRVFAKLDDIDYERQVRAWSEELEQAGAAEADVLHVHHLTPLNEAAGRVASHVPVVGHLHGTELLMLERIAEAPPAEWRYAHRWADRMRRWAHCCARLLVVPGAIDRACELLELPPERLVALPGGVDVDLFSPRESDRERFWTGVLSAHPRGWLPGEKPGSAAYERTDAARLAEGVVFLYVGRFTAVKRLDVLLGAFGQAQTEMAGAAGLVLVGGHPDEWESEHPAEIAARLNLSGIFLAGWYEQEELPEFFAAADAVVIASDREQFGQVLVEGMACGLPAVATDSLGPASIVEDGRTGWLVPRDDAGALGHAIAEAARDPDERSRRGRSARESVCERFSWPSITDTLVSVLCEVVTAPAGTTHR